MSFREGDVNRNERDQQVHTQDGGRALCDLSDLSIAVVAQKVEGKL